MDSSSSFLFGGTAKIQIFLKKNDKRCAPLFRVYSTKIHGKPPSHSNDTPTKTATQSISFPLPKPQTPVATSPWKSPTTERRQTQLSLPTFIFNALDDIIDNFIDPPLRPSVDPTRALSDNFFPVEELPPTECAVIGELPPCLEGAYIRNGPNAQYLPRGPFHLFDGDGMLHAFKISQGGRATLCSRYVKTYKYKVERDIGSPVFPNVFSGFNTLPAMVARGALTAARVLAGQFDPLTNGIGLANTSLAFFPNKKMLFALGESDLPYAVRLTPEGDIHTLGRHDFDGKLSMSMTAHPKVDAETGEVFAFRYSPLPPFLTYFWFDAKGSKQEDVPIFSMLRPSFLHDFAITKKYAVFADIQLGMVNPVEYVMRASESQSPVGADPGKVSRIGVIPRYAKDDGEMKWFEVPGFNIIHAINAWDEGEDEIVLIAPNIISVEHTLERMELVHASVEKVRVNLNTGIVSRFPLSASNLDFGVINPQFMGRKNRYGYAAVGDPMPKISGVVKLDWSESESEGGAQHKERIVGCRMYGRGCYGGEPFFVPKSYGSGQEQEDDGYLVTYVHDEKVGESQFLVMDPKSPTLDVVARVKLPRRVPYGFHGIFVRDDDLRNL